jgi:cold shock CspA family protein
MKQTTKFKGVVKWFNDEKGFGFIKDVKSTDYKVEVEENAQTVDEWDNTDVFCYYKHIKSSVNNNENSSMDNSYDSYGQSKKGKFRTLNQDDTVEFIIRKDNEGRPQAHDVELVQEKK